MDGSLGGGASVIASLSEGLHTIMATATDSGGLSDSDSLTIIVGNGTSVATLSWTPPTEHTDGSPLLDLGGYKIYFGPTEDNYTELVNLANPGLAMYVTDPLPPGTYYFVITAYDSGGRESGHSNVASTTIN